MPQPLMMFSAQDAPRSPDLPVFAPGEARGLSLAWNRMIRPIVFAEMRRRYAPRINRLRRSLGLGPTGEAPVFEISKQSALVLGLYSPLFAPPAADLSANTRVTGFTFFDSSTGAPERLDSETEILPGAWRGAARFHTRIGRRACARRLLRLKPFRGETAWSPRGSADRRMDDVLAPPGRAGEDYLPHSLVFPRAAAIIHHGGMGTTAQALRGRESLNSLFLILATSSITQAVLSGLVSAPVLRREQYSDPESGRAPSRDARQRGDD